jgi:esterase/lipase
MDSRNFTEVIAEFGAGRLQDKLSEKLAEVVRAVGETNLAGEVTLKLSLKPSGDGAVTMHADVKSKVPERGIGDAIFYSDNSGNLSRRDPRQIEMPLRSVSGAAVNA